MKFLVFQHVPNEHPGLFTKIADLEGIELEVVKFWEPYKIPQILGYNALIILGGPMGVYEDDIFPSKKDEVKVIKEALGKIPILGICLGSQLLASSLGSRVYPNMKEGKRVKEIGYYKVELTSEGKIDPLFEGFSPLITVLQWHGDIFDLPPGAKLLATSPIVQNQAFSYPGNAYGVLFHFEFTTEMVAKQIDIDRAWIHKDHEVNEDQLLEEAKDNSIIMQQQCERLFNNFLTIVRNQNS